MEFQNLTGENSTGKSNEPLGQLERALDKGMSKIAAEYEYGTLISNDDAVVGERSENASYLKIHDTFQFPDHASFTSNLPEFSPYLCMDAFTDKRDESNGKVFERSNSPFEMLPGPDFLTRNAEQFQVHSRNLGLRPRSYSDRDDAYIFPKRRYGADVNNFCEEMKTKPMKIFSEKSSTVVHRPFHFQDQRRRASVKITKNQNVMEVKGERSYRKEKLHKTTSSSSTFSPRRDHMPVTRSKSFGGKPNDPWRGSYGSMDSHGKGVGMPSLRRQALTNAASLSLAIATKNPVSYQEPTNDLNQEYRPRMRKLREDNRTQNQKQSKHGTHSRKSFHRMEFIGLVPVLNIPGIDAGEVAFCPPSGCKHIRIVDCPWPSKNGETEKIEFFHPNPDAADLDEGFVKTMESRTNSLSDYSQSEADDTFSQKFRNLESYWNRRHSSPLFPSPWSSTSSRPSIWLPSEANLSTPFSLHLSNSAPCTPCNTPVSLKFPSISDLANTESTSPTIFGGNESGFFQDVRVFRKPEDIPQHHPALKRNMPDPPGGSTWHPLHSSLKSPLSQDLESGKHFSYDK